MLVQRHMHTHYPSHTPDSQLLNPLKLLCVHGGAVESCVVCNDCSRRRTVCTVSGREWCEVRKSNRSTVHCTRVWCGVWVVLVWNWWRCTQSCTRAHLLTTQCCNGVHACCVAEGADQVVMHGARWSGVIAPPLPHLQGSCCTLEVWQGRV